VRMRKHRLLSGIVWGLLIAFSCVVQSAVAQTSAPNQWTWRGGNKTLLILNGQQTDVGWPGIYGTLGVPSAANIPGARDSGATWTDQNGNFWLFGGKGYDSGTGLGELNDLWEYNIAAQQWTWVGGSNILPIPQFQTGQPGVYGTLGVAAPGNIPGGREKSVTWTDKTGELWLFGGEGYGTVNSFTGNIYYNDLWKFDPATGQWAWMGGDNKAGITTSGQSGVYGTLGSPAAQNLPGSRFAAVSWTDDGGNLWLFGGEGLDSVGYSAYLNDLWKFNPSTNQWAWMGGSSTIDPGLGGRPGVYGTIHVPAPSNVPGSRMLANSWLDSSGNFWLFGGAGYDSEFDIDGYLNDLWEFTSSTNEWTWRGGSSILPCNNCGEYGAYGTLGLPASGNSPGGRSGAINWTDSSGNLWLVAGVGRSSSGPTNLLNDLWEFDPSTNRWAWMGGDAKLPPCQGAYNCGWPGVYGTVGVSAAANIPGSRENAPHWTDHDGNLWLFGGYGTDSLYQVSELNDLWSYQPSSTSVFPVAATPTFSPGEGTYTSVQWVQITDATPGAAIYYTTDGVTVPTNNSTKYSQAIFVSANTTIQAIALATNFLNSPVASAHFTMNLPPADFSVSASPSSLAIPKGLGANTTVSVMPANGFSSAVSLTCSGQPAGYSCNFSAPTMTPVGTAASTTTLYVIPSATSPAIQHTSLSYLPGSTLAVALCCLGWRKRRTFTMLAVLGCVAGLGVISGCGAGGQSSTPQPAPSTITITATSGSIHHTTTFMLTFN
jgi:N-acetylneuraminic acid mutarotase